MSKKRELEIEKENIDPNSLAKKINLTRQKALSKIEFKDYLILHLAKLAEFENVQHIIGRQENIDTDNLIGDIDTNVKITDTE